MIIFSRCPELPVDTLEVAHSRDVVVVYQLPDERGATVVEIPRGSDPVGWVAIRAR
jgi:hypothetical protein